MKWFCSTCLMIISFTVIGQDTVKVKNNSFEGSTAMESSAFSFKLKKWIDCGDKRYFNNGHHESPPDILPNGKYGITLYPSDGKSYVGLVVRDIDTWEAISQSLDGKLLKNHCYEFFIDLAQSEIFNSFSRNTGKKASFVNPTKFRMWGGNESCEEQQLLAESPPIDFFYWQTFKFKIKPTEDITYITLEAIYTSTKLEPYNGHILIDNMSNIIEVDFGK